jgi:haloalkane dehalogenase
MELDWIDRKEYPFEPRYLELPMGRMHYVDEGEGEPILMLHGNPTWSFLYRHLIKCLSRRYRCVAPDYIGFGLSDKPRDWSYRPEDHARNIEALIAHLDLKGLTLVGQDWGGPIGLSYALGFPANVRRVVIMNTWMWPVKGDPHFERFSAFMGGAAGRFLIRRFNVLASFFMKRLCETMTPEVHRHYLKPMENPQERKGSWTFLAEIIGSTQWLASLWERREMIRNIPALVLWGKRDPAFREDELERWMAEFVEQKVFVFEDAGHFVPEDKGEGLCPLVEDFMETAS